MSNVALSVPPIGLHIDESTNRLLIFLDICTTYVYLNGTHI